HGSCTARHATIRLDELNRTSRALASDSQEREGKQRLERDVEDGASRSRLPTPHGTGAEATPAIVNEHWSWRFQDHGAAPPRRVGGDTLRACNRRAAEELGSKRRPFDGCSSAPLESARSRARERSVT